MPNNMDFKEHVEELQHLFTQLPRDGRHRAHCPLPKAEHRLKELKDKEEDAVIRLA
jgi:hypothetical protein